MYVYSSLIRLDPYIGFRGSGEYLFFIFNGSRER